LSKHIYAAARVDDQEEDNTKDQLSLSILAHFNDWNANCGPNKQVLNDDKSVERVRRGLPVVPVIVDDVAVVSETREQRQIEHEQADTSGTRLLLQPVVG